LVNILRSYEAYKNVSILWATLYFIFTVCFKQLSLYMG